MRDHEQHRDAPSSSEPSPNTYPTHLDNDPEADDEIEGRRQGFVGLGGKAVTETTALLKKPFEFIAGPAHSGPCDHGTFSPRLESRAGSVRSGGFGGSPSANGESSGAERNKSIFANIFENVGLKNGSGGGKKKMSTTSYLAERHGITNTTSMYVMSTEVLPIRKLIRELAGTSPTISRFWLGYDSIDGSICKAIL